MCQWSFHCKSGNFDYTIGTNKLLKYYWLRQKMGPSHDVILDQLHPKKGQWVKRSTLDGMIEPMRIMILEFLLREPLSLYMICHLELQNL